jgi:DNA-binding SARP family transcriptional activator
MAILQITLFGGVHITHNNWLTEVKVTRDLQALLAYLLLQRHRTHPREVLAEKFWGERSQKKAQGSLNTALWKLKRALEPDGVPAGTYLISAYPNEVGFNRKSRYWLDVEFFEDKSNQLLSYPSHKVNEPLIQDFERILKFYKGELLEGFFDDWAIRERERFRSLYIKSLITLLKYYEKNELYENGLEIGQLVLDLDPLREEVHRMMMRLFLQNGQRVQAVLQYEICRSVLERELGIQPMEETQALYHQIVAEPRNHQPPEITDRPITLAEAIEQLRQARKTLELTQGQVHNALHFIERYTESEG